MRRSYLLLLITLGLLPAHAFAQSLPRTFSIDASHSSVVFKVPFMGMSTVTGEFQDFAGALLLADTPEQSAVTVVIKTKSLSSHSTTRDNHLRSPDFFAADSFPLITFQSTRVRKNGAGWIAQGLLTMRGVARVIDLPFTQLQAPMKDAWGNTRVTFRATHKLSRQEYNIKGTAFWNGEFDPGRFAVADTATIELEVSATIPNTAKWTVPKTDSLVNVVESQGVERLIASLSVADTAGLPNDNQVFITAFKLVQRGRTTEGIRLFDWGLGRYKESRLVPMAASILGDTQLRIGKRADAVRSFKRALSADPNDPIANAWLRYLHEEPIGR
jgi:polyisoprenoid-binding protein YceI